jgi:hypothetical protein
MDVPRPQAIVEIVNGRVPGEAQPLPLDGGADPPGLEPQGPCLPFGLPWRLVRLVAKGQSDSPEVGGGRRTCSTAPACATQHHHRALHDAIQRPGWGTRPGPVLHEDPCKPLPARVPATQLLAAPVHATSFHARLLDTRTCRLTNIATRTQVRAGLELLDDVFELEAQGRPELADDALQAGLVRREEGGDLRDETKPEQQTQPSGAVAAHAGQATRQLGSAGLVGCGADTVGILPSPMGSG